MDNIKNKIIINTKKEINNIFRNIETMTLKDIIQDITSDKHYNENISKIQRLLNMYEDENFDIIVDEILSLQTHKIYEEVCNLLKVNDIKLIPKIDKYYITFYYEDEELICMNIKNRYLKLYPNKLSFNFIFNEPLVCQEFSIVKKVKKNNVTKDVYCKLKKTNEFVREKLSFKVENDVFRFMKLENPYELIKDKLLKDIDSANNLFNTIDILNPQKLFNQKLCKFYAIVYKKHYTQLLGDCVELEKNNKIQLEKMLLEVQDYIDDFNAAETHKEFIYPINDKLYQVKKTLNVLLNI